ncbi:hypothetical protein NECAME_12094 [Necator americanus]|uniref:Uncharacterized protein n=1 Tax=Necator americanus TaxID=51031 RepID=W2T1F1_NECAM|nr:hypothetical protein NECAME_12094 [Necator americanus]ETN75815.1 hypothetical protein NECAME_12094 [Necator americanus]
MKISRILKYAQFTPVFLCLVGLLLFALVSTKWTLREVKAPKGKRIHLTIEKIKGTCVPGCWRETAEFKVRMDKRITGNRFCCDLASKKRVLSNSDVVPVMLKAVRKSAQVIVQYSFVDENIARDYDVENLEETSNIAFGAGVKTIGENNEFELEIQKPLKDGERADVDEEPIAEVGHDEGSGEDQDHTAESNNIRTDFYALPSLEPDLEDVLHEGQDIETKSTS